MEPARFRDFTIYVDPVRSRTRGRYRVSLRGLLPGGYAGPEEYAIKTYDPGVFTVASDGVAVDLLSQLRKRKITEDQLYRFGIILSDLLLPAPIRARFHDSLAVLRRSEQRLRLRLSIRVKELMPLPWEYLYLQTRGVQEFNALDFLALQPDISIVRHVAIDEPEPPVVRRDTYRLVAALADPPDQEDRLNLGQDRNAIESMIRRVAGIGAVQLVWVENATRPSLRDALREGADIFHFAGHGYFDGKEGQILLSREGDGTTVSDFYGAGLLASLLRDARVKLAVFGACEAGQLSGENVWGGVASALTLAGIPAVVASQLRLQDVNAAPLAEELYRYVLAGSTIDEAVYNARQSIFQQSGLVNRDWGAPVLYLRVEDGVIFPVAEGLSPTASLTLSKPASAEGTPPPPPAPGGIIPSTTKGKPKEAVGTPAGAGTPQTLVNIYQTIESVQNSQVTGLSAGFIGTSQTSAGSVLRGAPPRIAPTPLQTLLVGRDDELAEAEAGLRNGGKYHIHGMYGVGKTSLLTEIFLRIIKDNAFPDGYIWADASKMTADKALEWVAATLDEQKVAQATERSAKINALREALARRDRFLIGLDEVDSPEVAIALLQAAGNCTVMFNGLQPFELGGLARDLDLKPLSPDEAEQLFVTLAKSPSESFADEERQYIRRICEKMGFLPLAIGLAALKHAEGEPLPDLLEAVDSAASTLVSPDSPVALIFTAVYAGIEPSQVARRLLVRIANFPSMNAALAPLREGLEPPDFFNAKDALIALGLVSYAGTGRLALHPLLGRLALAKEDRTMVEAERKWVANWLLKYAQEHQDHYDMLAREHNNLLGIFERLASSKEGDRSALFTLARSIFNYLRVRGFWAEARQELDTLLRSSAPTDLPIDTAYARYNSAIIYLLQSSYAAAEAELDTANAIFSTEGNDAGRGLVLYRRAVLGANKGDLTLARRQLEEAIELMSHQALPADKLGERLGASEQLASIVAAQGDPQEARRQYEAALALSEKVGDIESQSRLHSSLGRLSRNAGEHADAMSHYQKAAELSAQLGNLRHIAQITMELGNLAYIQGKYDDAQESFQRAQDLFGLLKYKPGQAQALHDLGNIALQKNDLDEAEATYQAALDINSQLKIKSAIARDTYQLGLVAQRRGRQKDARTAYNAVLKAAKAKEMKDLSLQAASLHQLGRLALDAHYFKRAKTQAAQSLRLARKVKDRLTEVLALTLTGLVQLHEGNLKGAKSTLTAAQKAFADLNAPQAEQVQQLIDELTQQIESQSAASPPKDKSRSSKRIGKKPGAVDNDRVVEGGGGIGGIVLNIDRVVEGVSGTLTGIEIDRIVEGVSGTLTGIEIDRIGG